MCGIFGIVRSGTASADADRRALQILTALGMHSEERGTDASGIAALTVTPGRRTVVTSPTRKHRSKRSNVQVTRVDDMVTLKTAGRFSRLPLPQLDASALAAFSLFLGHTRSATQGAASDLKNASPMFAGHLLGTHNGDVDVTTIPNVTEHKTAAAGKTDSELLLLALNATRTDRRGMTSVLREVHGRVALAFVDRSRTDRLFLARGAMSPLAYAVTGDGDFVYASNPDWFRRIEKDTHGRLTFHDITLVPEGHLVTVDTIRGTVIDVRRFTATCRDSDLALLNTAAYKRFTPEDKAAYSQLTRHKVAVTPLAKAWPTLTLAPAITAPKSPARSDWLWDDTEPEQSVVLDFTVEEVEELCWAFGSFDHHRYNEIADASDADAMALMELLRAEVRAAFDEGLTAPGWQWPEIEDSAA